MELNQHDEFKRNNFIKKLVSNSRAIISNQIALPLGVQKMKTIIYWIGQIAPIDNIDLDVFQEYMAQTANLPIGTERLTYNPEFLKQQDTQLDYLTTRYKDEIIDKCFEIIKNLSDGKNETES
ncbi:hypothetical protein [Mucilaginibacter psychrotolerans]|uniref:DUF2489 domain-containing protein n=1 Tax=Mucilaginibacter psychrotolerans TaxID=1524096 RepID=A0A4Y8S7P4_9SPHI|nr:hypothetical protein [Mucilaginibacter psychrotolerans]TFF34942.1 hypothetical protein E2R66_20445 [Mucilaginibacter psychrotolerans]